MQSSRSKIPSKNLVHIYIYDVKFLALLGAPYVYNINRLRVKNKKDKTCILIGVVIPVDRNIAQKETEKKQKYTSFCIEIQQMWNMKCIIGATGRVKKGFRQLLEVMPGKHSTNSHQRTAVHGTSHKIWKVLQSET
jgi:hypothetical protein